jgi:DNA end-binding protein Ku
MSVTDIRNEQMFPELSPQEIGRLRRFGEVRRYAVGDPLLVTGEGSPGMEHVVTLEPFGKGLLGVTLRYAYEVGDGKAYFENIPGLKLPKGMRELTNYIIDSKAAHFDPCKFIDRYEATLAALLPTSELDGRSRCQKPETQPGRVINLIDALRASVAANKRKKQAEIGRTRPLKRKMRQNVARPK